MSAFSKRRVTLANSSSSGNVPLLVELFMISANIGKSVSSESIKSFTGIQELMADFFPIQRFFTFLTASDDTSFK